MSEDNITRPGPQELADYLKQDGIKKARGKFANGVGGRCCLGHYADMCGVDYLPEQGTFECDSWQQDWWHEHRAAHPCDVPPPALPALQRAGLPKGHWLLRCQAVLADLNDSTAGFDATIEKLEEVAAQHPELG